MAKAWLSKSQEFFEKKKKIKINEFWHGEVEGIFIKSLKEISLICRWDIVEFYVKNI